MNEFVIDAFEFCRRKGRRNGEITVSKLPRLAKETIGQVGSIQWSLEGGKDTLGRPMLMMSVSGTAQLMCQRCLSPMMFDIASMANLILAKDEVEADEIELTLDDDDAFDVIAGSAAMNILDLVEDDVLLAIPSSPKHEICPDQTVSTKHEAEKVSPFAVLKNLK